MADAAGKLTVDELKRLVETGEIDTVISAVCDMQGRLVGKRVTASYFVDHCSEHGTHFCTYLLGTDMEMNTPDGFALMNWESGYGDYLARPDWSTLRASPGWRRPRSSSPTRSTRRRGELVPVAPRSILRRQIERIDALGFTADDGHRAGVLPADRHLRAGARQGLRRAQPLRLVQRGLPAPPGDQGRTALPPVPQR